MSFGQRLQSDSSSESAGPIVSLRPLVHADVGSEYLGWLQDNCVNEYLSVESENLSMEELHLYLDNSMSSERTNFAITLKDSGLHIGNASIYQLDVTNGTFRMGWFIGNRHYWGGRIALQAIALILSKGFARPQLETCIGSVNKNHIKARLNNRLAGFEEHPMSLSDDPGKRYLALTLSRVDWIEKMWGLRQRFPSEFRWFDEF